MTRIVALAAILFAFAERASACAVCYGDPESDQTRALTIAIALLLTITASILTTIVVVAVRIAKRSAVSEQSPTADGAGG